MDVRTPFFQNIACVLIGVLFLNPIVSTAAELALDAQAGSNAAVTQAANGVSMVNIATPNGSGLSHNKFTDFNVSQQGLILNNSAQAVVQTQLGGYVMGNPNLTGGAANIILNEVNGGSPSQLKGYTEVAGKSAAVIVANPHGISCDGCGFINTPRVTLSTGKPVVEGGRLDRFDVEGGQISIEGDGLNARNVSQFDLITRSAQINAELHANQLNVITGRNDVDAANLTATVKADDGSAKPQLAIDSSALGGMYAGAIRLVGTEAGVGVKLAGDMAASAGDIQIDANGQLSMARTAASRDLQLKADSIELNADTFAGRNAVVDASGQTLVKESLAATQQLTVKGGELLNQGVVEAGVRADGSLNNTATLSLQTNTVTNPGTITSHGNLNSDVQTLDNRAGKLLSASDATLKAQTLENSGGRIVAQQNLDLSGTQLNNQDGEILAQQNITVTAANLDNQDGTVAGDALDLQLSANLNNQNGLVESASDLQLAANTLSNNGGKLRALGGEGDSRFVLGGLFNNDAGLVEIGSGAFALSSVGLSNLGGTVRHTGNQGFNLDLGDIGLAGGSFSTAGELTVQADAWSNSSQLQAERLTLAVGEFTQTASGKLLSRQSIVATGDNWTNHGSIETDGELELDLTGSYSGNGSLLSQGDLIFTAASASIGAAAKVRSGGQADFSLTSSFENRGVISAADALLLSASSLNNFGTLGAGAALLVQSNSMRNEGGLLFSGSQMQLRGDSLVNQRGDLYSVGNFSFAALAPSDQAARFSNVSGTLESEADVSIQAKLIENIRESLDIVTRKVAVQFYDRDCTDCSGDKENVRYRLREIERTEGLNVSPQSSLLAGGNLLLSSDDLANHSSLISANGNVQIDTTRFDNKGAQTGEYLITRRATSEREKSTGFIVDAVNDFNAQNWPNASANVNAQLNHILSKYLPSHTGPSVTFTPDAVQAYAAIIQAGGDVQINAPEQLNSGVIRPSFSYVAGGSRDPGTSAPGTSIATVVTLNTQLPPDLAQQAVDPLALPGFNLPQGQNGLFQINTQVGHRYLIETNPVFASLKNFLNSDYMLGNLGYDPQTAQKRLGDGFYEQRLIREAVVARTGQRYLAGLDSDEAQFRYLMDNAIVSKDALNLSLGVSLTAEQVAALTHDLVWMEEREVAGQKVLVPVLYLAQAEGRLAPNGALIQGRDVALISGGNLTNQGTLRASNNLSVTTSNISNSGLMQASERLSLLATDSIRNAQGGIIAGKDVTAIALTGDIVNERTVTRHESGKRGYQHQQDFVDSAARIGASGDLTLAAGRDIQNIGSALKTGGDMQLDAGRDLAITSAQEQDFTNRTNSKGYSRRSDITQYGSEVQATGDLQALAGRDLAVIASSIKAAGDIELQATGDLTIGSAANESHYDAKHKGGSRTVARKEDHVQQQSSVIEAGGNFISSSGADTNLVASQITAGEEAYLYAKGDLNLDTADNQDYSYAYEKKKSGGLLTSKKKSSMTESASSQAVSSSIRSGSDLTLVANNDVAVNGAQLSSDEAITIYAGRNIILDAAENTASQASAKSKSSLFSSKSSTNSSDSTSLTSTSLNGKSVELLADNDITLRAAAVHAEEGIVLDAGSDIAISTSQQSQQSSQASKSNKLNWHLTDSLATNGSFTLENKGKGAKQSSIQEVGSTLSGATIDIDSGRDTSIRGSTLVADHNIRVDAGRNLSVVSGETSNNSSASSKSKNAGEIGNWYQGATGVASLKQTNESSSNTQNSSQIASLGGNVDLRAGERYNQVASQVIAPTGDISIIGKQVDIEAGYDTLSATQKQSSSRTAIGGSVSVPLVDAVRNIQQMGEAAGNTGDTRLKALAAVNAGMYATTAYNSAQALANGTMSGIKISVNLSNDKGNSKSTQSGQNVVSSTIAAGGDLNITATGAGDGSDINVVGSQLSAGGDAKLKADGDINLLAAKNTAEQHGNNAGAGWSVGVGFALAGSQNGFTLDLAANKSRGNADGSDVSWTNTTIQAGNALGFWSGEDTNLKGAIASGEQVVADVGGNLNIESLQDTSTYKSKQSSASAGVSLCIPPFCYGAPAGSVSASAGQQKIDSEYASVIQQSGVKAGDKGFNITVGGNTDLKGAVIASTEQAIQTGKNQLVTGTLTSSDIENEAEYQASSINLSGGYSWGTGSGKGGVGKDKDGNASAGAAGEALPNKGGFSATAPIALSASDDASSTTKSGISGGTILITDPEKQKLLTGKDGDTTVAQLERDVSSEKDGANALKPIFDEEEILAGFEITTAFVQNVGTFLETKAREADAKKDVAKAIEAEADNYENDLTTAERLALRVQAQALKDEAKVINDNWGAGGTYRQIATVLTAAAGGQVNAGTSQFAQNMVVNYLQQQGAGYIGKLVEKGALVEGSPLHAALHAIVGCGAAAASQQSCSAGVVGGAASSVLTGLFSETSPDETSEQREAKRNLILSIVTGIAAVADPDSAATANNAATANVDNNWLATQQKVQRNKELAEAETLAEQFKINAKWLNTSAEQDLSTGVGLVKGLKDGLADSGLDTLNTMARFAAFPGESLDEISEMISAPAMKQLLGAKYDEMQQSIEKAKVSLEVGGLDHAEQLGMQIGHIISVAITLVVAVEADAVKAAGQAAKFGVAVSKEQAGALMAGSSGKLAAQLATIEKYGFDGDVPTLPQQPGTSITPVFKDTNTGLNAINPIVSNSRGRIKELGFDPDTKKINLHEGQTAVQLENTFGSTLKRVEPTPGQKNPDFIFVDGPYAGKTVDFMWTDQSRSVQLNKFFSVNAERNLDQLVRHMEKADIVPLDYRNLTIENQNIINGWVERFSQEQKAKLLILR